MPCLGEVSDIDYLVTQFLDPTGRASLAAVSRTFPYAGSKVPYVLLGTVTAAAGYYFGVHEFAYRFFNQTLKDEL